MALEDLPCPLCGENIDILGPAVASNRSDYDPQHGPSGTWRSFWVPFVEDLRGSQQRLAHPRCYANEAGFDALITLITTHDQQMRLDPSRRRPDG